MHLKKRWSNLAKKIVGLLPKNMNSEIKPPLESKMRLQNIFESIIGYDLCQRGGLISSPRQGPLSLKYSIFCLVTQNMPHRTTKVFKLYFKFMVWCSFFSLYLPIFNALLMSIRKYERFNLFKLVYLFCSLHQL